MSISSYIVPVQIRWFIRLHGDRIWIITNSGMLFPPDRRRHLKPNQIKDLDTIPEREIKDVDRAIELFGEWVMEELK